MPKKWRRALAEDQAEIVSIGETVTVPAGTYENTLFTRETSPLEPGDESFKRYAPGVGLIVDDVVELVRVGSDGDDDEGDDDDEAGQSNCPPNPATLPIEGWANIVNRP